MLYEAGIGDAYGAAFEYVNPFIYPNDLSKYYQHPRHKIGAGKYTDDTEMSTAVAEAMLECWPNGLTNETLAKWFVKAFQREQRLGYANGFYNFMKSITTGQEFLDKIKPYSDKSGAAMRGWVCGLYKDMYDAMAMAELQARVTHDTFGGRTSAIAAALLVHYCLYNIGPRTAVDSYILQHVEGPWTDPKIDYVGSSGIESVHAAIQAVVKHDKMSTILKQCIDYSGDVDTVATIALGAASFSAEVEQDLPDSLKNGLEEGEWGGTYLKKLDERLFETFGLTNR